MKYDTASDWDREDSRSDNRCSSRSQIIGVSELKPSCESLPEALPAALPQRRSGPTSGLKMAAKVRGDMVVHRAVVLSTSKRKTVLLSGMLGSIRLGLRLLAVTAIGCDRRHLHIARAEVAATLLHQASCATEPAIGLSCGRDRESGARDAVQVRRIPPTSWPTSWPCKTSVYLNMQIAREDFTKWCSTISRSGSGQIVQSQISRDTATAKQIGMQIMVRHSLAASNQHSMSGLLWRH